MAYLLPWHGQSMVPSATLLTVQPWCVQMAEKALKVPGAGWVTTTLSAPNTLPPPTGMSLVDASRLPVGAADSAGGCPADVGGCCDCDAGAAAGVRSLLHAASAADTAKIPEPATTARRVSSDPGGESCNIIILPEHGTPTQTEHYHW